MEKLTLRIISTLIIIFGIFLATKPSTIAKALKSFYSKYPIVRYFGDKELSARSIYIIISGVVIIFIGTFCLFFAK